MAKYFKAVLLVLVATATCLTSNFAVATAINATDPFHYLDNISDNSVGIQTGVRQQFGAVSVVPNGDNETAGVACQNSVCLPLIFFPFDAAPNFFGRSIAFNPHLTGSWTLTFTNGPDTSDPKVTPTTVGAQVVPFVNSVTISGSGAVSSTPFMKTIFYDSFRNCGSNGSPVVTPRCSGFAIRRGLWHPNS